MPLIHIEINRVLETQPNTNELISIIAEILKKPTERVIVKWSDNQNISFGKYDEHGDRKPALICSVLAVYNFEPKINKEVDEAMVPALVRSFGIPKEGIAISFSCIEPGFALIHF